MDPVPYSPWVQIAITWGSGPVVLGLLGAFQWWRDRKDKVQQRAEYSIREDRRESDARDAAIDAGFDRLSKDQQDYVANIKQDRDALRKRCDELETENRRIHENIWDALLWGRDMRNAALNARSLVDQQSVRLSEPPHNWQELPEWKN